MAKDTTIQWVDSTVNPVAGCDGCELWNRKKGIKTCYAGVLHDRYGGKNKGFAPTFEQVTLFAGRMKVAAGWSDLTGMNRADKLWLNGLPRHIFVSDMSDALSASVPFDYLKTEIIDVVSSDKGRRHVWMWLTKQSKRLAAFAAWLAMKHIPWPENLWMGVSVTTQPTISRVLDLDAINTIPHRFISAEPLFGAVKLPPALDADKWEMLICGGASGADAKRFYIDWAVDLRGECRLRGFAYFQKQLGANVWTRDFPDPLGHRIKLKDSHGGDWNEWPADLRVREFPNIMAARTA